MITSAVTGAAGFLGLALVRRLLQHGDAVRAVVLPGDPAVLELERLGREAAGRITVIEGDVANADAIAPVFDGADRVFHTAALVHAWAPRSSFERVNINGSRNVAELALAHGITRVVAISTTDVFGLPEGDTVFTERSPHREWNEPYADTKIQAERWLWRLHRESGLPVSVIYPGWIYGPGDKAFFPGLAEAIRKGRMAFWCRDVRLPFVYVDNLVDACMLAASEPQAVGNGFIVFDTDAGPTLEQLCGQIAATIGAPAPHRHIPYSIALASAQVLQATWTLLRRKDPPPLLTVDVKAFGQQFHLSNEKARRELGWSPRVTMEDGLRAALADLRSRRRSTL